MVSARWLLISQVAGHALHRSAQVQVEVRSAPSMEGCCSPAQCRSRLLPRCVYLLKLCRPQSCACVSEIYIVWSRTDIVSTMCWSVLKADHPDRHPDQHPCHSDPLEAKRLGSPTPEDRRSFARFRSRLHPRHMHGLTVGPLAQAVAELQVSFIVRIVEEVLVLTSCSSGLGSSSCVIC